MSLPAPLVSAQWLEEKLGTPGLVIVDASWYMPAQNRSGKAEYAAERHYRDARQLMIVEGTSQIQRLIIAKELFLRNQ